MNPAPPVTRIFLVTSALEEFGAELTPNTSLLGSTFSGVHFRARAGSCAARYRASMEGLGQVCFEGFRRPFQRPFDRPEAARSAGIGGGITGRAVGLVLSIRGAAPDASVFTSEPITKHEGHRARRRKRQ